MTTTVKVALLALLAVGAPAATAAPPPQPVPAVHTPGFGLPQLPIRGVAAAADGSWVAFCQARTDTDRNGSVSVEDDMWGSHGDAQRAYLAIGGGAGVELDDILAIDPSGRRIAVRRGTRAMLEQPGLGSEVDLTSLGLDGDLLAFAPDGDTLAFGAHVHGHAAIAILTPATGALRTLDIGRGRLYAFELAPGGRWISARVLALRPGDEPWHSTRDVHHPWCWTGYGGDVITDRGTPPETRLLPVAGGAARVVPDLVAVVGDHLIRRAPDGALTSIASDGTTAEVVPAACGGRLESDDPATGALVVACTHLGAPAPLFVYGRGAPRSLGAAVGDVERDWPRSNGRYLLASDRDADDLIIDLVTGARRRSPVDQRALFARGDRLLVARHGEFLWIDPGGEHWLGPIVQYPDVLVTGRFAYVDPLVVDLDSGALVGTTPIRVMGPLGYQVPGTVSALAADGRLLVAFSTTMRRGFAPGPLEWLAPGPATIPPRTSAPATPVK